MFSEIDYLIIFVPSSFYTFFHSFRYLSVHPKGVSGRFNGHLCLFLNVANRKSLRTGWRRSVKFCFLVLNESNKELYRSPGNGVTSFPVWLFYFFCFCFEISCVWSLQTCSTKRLESTSWIYMNWEVCWESSVDSLFQQRDANWLDNIPQTHVWILKR